MALEDFIRNEDDKDEDTAQETSSEKNEGGIESFRTDTTRGDSTDESEEKRQIHDLPSRRWNNMSKEERVKYVRENHIPDFDPDCQPDSRWSYQRCIEVVCVCGNSFTFVTSGVCLRCGRGYEDAGRTIVKKYDPHTDGEQRNEPN